MKCLFYEKKPGVIAERIIRLMQPSPAENKIELYHTIKTLSQRLSRPIDGQAIMIFIAADRVDLLDIVLMHKLLFDIRVIIILPDSEDESVRIGYKLKPCFLTYANGDLDEVHKVLGKLLKLSESGQRISGEPFCGGNE